MTTNNFLLRFVSTSGRSNIIRAKNGKYKYYNEFQNPKSSTSTPVSLILYDTNEQAVIGEYYYNDITCRIHKKSSTSNYCNYIIAANTKRIIPNTVIRLKDIEYVVNYYNTNGILPKVYSYERIGTKNKIKLTFETDNDEYVVINKTKIENELNMLVSQQEIDKFDHTKHVEVIKAIRKILNDSKPLEK